MSWVSLLFAFSLAENVVFARLLGLDPEAAEGSDHRLAAAAALACGLLAASSTAVAWVLREAAFAPIGAFWLQTPAVVLATAGIASLARLVLARLLPRSADLFGPVLRPSGASVAALGTALVVIRSRFALAECIVAGLAAGVGLLLARSILAGIADRLAPNAEPSPMSGLPRALVSAGLASLAFSAFDRLVLAGLVR